MQKIDARQAVNVKFDISARYLQAARKRSRRTIHSLAADVNTYRTPEKSSDYRGWRNHEAVQHKKYPYTVYSFIRIHMTRTENSMLRNFIKEYE
jgi:hypothetical protein